MGFSGVEDAGILPWSIQCCRRSRFKGAHSRAVLHTENKSDFQYCLPLGLKTHKLVKPRLGNSFVIGV